MVVGSKLGIHRVADFVKVILEPGMTAVYFEADADRVPVITGGTSAYGDVAVAVEVVERLANPQEFIRRCASNCEYLVALSPIVECLDDSCERSTQGWDMVGYKELLRMNGFDIVQHESVGSFQVILGKSSID